MIFDYYHSGDMFLYPFPLKPGFDYLKMCLGAKLSKTMLHEGDWAWAISPAKYVHEAVRNCKGPFIGKLQWYIPTT